MPRVTTATSEPYFVNSQKEIGWPLRFAIPATTTLALAPIAVALPPRSAPRTSAHHKPFWPPSGPFPLTSWSTTGDMVATNGMLSTIADNAADPHSCLLYTSDAADE